MNSTNILTSDTAMGFVDNTTLEMDINNATMLRNATVDDTTPAAKAQFLLYDLLVPAIGAVIMLLNLAVVVSSGLILKRGRQPRSTYLFLGNVAMTDFITGFAVVFGQTFPREYRDRYLCSFQIGLIVSSTLASVYSVGLIAIDRFLYILYGLQYQKWVYPNRARLSIGLTWIIGCIIGYMPLFGWYSDTENGKYCWFIRLAPKELMILTVAIGIIPILTVIVLYSIILYHAIKKIIHLQQATQDSSANNGNFRMYRGRLPPPTIGDPFEEKTNDSDTKPSNLFAKIFKKKPSITVSSPKKWKAIKVVLYTTCSFVITWSPYFIVSLIYAYTCEEENKRDTKRCKNISLLIASPLAILGFINSLMNPIIYAWWHKGFRTYVKKRVSTIILRRRTQNNLNQSTSKSNRKTSTTTTTTTSTPLNATTVNTIS